MSKYNPFDYVNSDIEADVNSVKVAELLCMSTVHNEANVNSVKVAAVLLQISAVSKYNPFDYVNSDIEADVNSVKVAELLCMSTVHNEANVNSVKVAAILCMSTLLNKLLSFCNCQQCQSSICFFLHILLFKHNYLRSY